MKKIAESALSLLRKNEDEIKKRMVPADGEISVCRDSIHKLGDALVMTGREAGERFLLVAADCRRVLPEGFEGEESRLDHGAVMVHGPWSAVNAAALRRHFPWTAPSLPQRKGRAICCDGRSEAARRGLLRAGRRFDATPIFEFAPSPDPTDAINEALFSIFEMNWRDNWSAEVGKIGTAGEAELAMAAGATILELDFSTPLPGTPGAETEARIESDYANRTFVVGSASVGFDAATARRCSALYGARLNFAARAFAAAKLRRSGFELAVALQESAPEHHLFVARELLLREIAFGAIGYAGADGQNAVHAAVARAYGDHELTVDDSGDGRLPCGCRFRAAAAAYAGEAAAMRYFEGFPARFAPGGH